MKIAGHTLVWIGFLVGAFLAVQRAEGLALGPFVAAVAVGALGIVLVRVGMHREARHEEKLEADIATIEESLGRVVADIEVLDREKDAVNVYDLRHRIDDTFVEDLAAFVEARESIGHSFGLQAYADVMNHFAAGERYLNRVWSASTDGYVDEAHEYIGRAHSQFSQALDRFRALARDAEVETGGEGATA